jgi:hypothetical protein
VSPPSLSERVERSGVAQLLISIAIVLVLLTEVATHLPTDSAVYRSTGSEANRLIRLVATEQQWGVFAPDPRQTSLRIEGRVTFEDGSTATWHLPEGPRLGANFRYYRWRKWLERVRSDEFQGLWDPTARWIASLYDDRDSPVAKVELVRLFHANVLTGPQPPYQEFTYHTYIVEPDDGAS